MKKLLSLFIALTLTGCASYRAAPLTRLTPEFAPYSEKKEGLTLACKAFNEADCKQYFDRNIIRKGFQPIQLTLQNETQKYYLFSTDGISLPTVPASVVADKCHTNTVARSATYGVVGIFIWPFLIPAIVDGVSSSKANQQLDLDFASKDIRNQVVQPFSTLNGVVFVPRPDFKDVFNISFVDRETSGKIEFRAEAK